MLRMRGLQPQTGVRLVPVRISSRSACARRARGRRMVVSASLALGEPLEIVYAMATLLDAAHAQCLMYWVYGEAQATQRSDHPVHRLIFEGINHVENVNKPAQHSQYVDASI